MCRYCETSRHVCLVKMANSASLLFTQLACDGISTRFELEHIHEREFYRGTKRKLKNNATHEPPTKRIQHE
jgi:hypothetical protein